MMDGWMLSYLGAGTPLGTSATGTLRSRRKSMYETFGE
jgi:hypothetical protein